MERKEEYFKETKIPPVGPIVDEGEQTSMWKKILKFLKF